MYGNIFYFKYINSIGGVESHFYYLAKKYQDLDITVFYDTADPEQLKRLSKLVRTEKYRGQELKCKKIFVNYSSEEILNTTEAEEYIFVIHADYINQTNLRFIPHPKITRYLAVSKQVAKNFEEKTGIKAEVNYNPIILEKPKRVLRLISATRLTAEKGRDRMVKLSEMLDNAKIPYQWIIFTNDPRIFKSPNVVIMPPRYDLIDYIADADYLVQLSDCEAYCYSVVEALSVGTPVLVTDLPVYHELGLKNGENSFLVDFNLDNLNVTEIYKKRLKFNFKAPEDNYKNILDQIPTTYKEELNTIVKVVPIKEYLDLELGKWVNEDTEPFEVDLVRAKYLVKQNLAKIL